MPQLPLDGIRVLDCSYVFALPYTGGLLSDFGAEVIKIEGPSHPDITRPGGLYGTFPENDFGADWWNRPSTYNLINRGKRSLTLDLSDPRGRDLFRQVVGVSDVVMENYTPRVMRRWELDYPNLRKIKPDIIMVSNTGYGHGAGPYSEYPAQATTQEGTHGHCWITGYQGDIPSKAGASYVDFLATWAALFAVGAALRYRNRTGQGQWVDLAMYQAGAMCISEYLMDAIANGRPGERIGNRHPSRAPQGCYPARGHDQWITLSAGDDSQWEALCRVMEQPELAVDSRFADALSRLRHHDQLDQIISAWTVEIDKYELMRRLQAAGVPAGPVLTGKDVHFDPQYLSRGFLEKVTYPPERAMGTRPFIGRPYKFSRSSLRIRGPAPAFGQDNELVLRELLGLDEADYERLVGEAVVATVPRSGEPAGHLPPEQAVASGLLGEWDPDYRERLGIS